VRDHLARLAPLAALVSVTVLTSTAAAGPQLGLEERPTYLGPREVVPTFDDARARAAAPSTGSTCCEIAGCRRRSSSTRARGHRLVADRARW
jgi:hypothetical protein